MSKNVIRFADPCIQWWLVVMLTGWANIHIMKAIWLHFNIRSTKKYKLSKQHEMTWSSLVYWSTSLLMSWGLWWLSVLIFSVLEKGLWRLFSVNIHKSDTLDVNLQTPHYCTSPSVHPSVLLTGSKRCLLQRVSMGNWRVSAWLHLLLASPFVETT